MIRGEHGGAAPLWLRSNSWLGTPEPGGCLGNLSTCGRSGIPGMSTCSYSIPTGLGRPLVWFSPGVDRVRATTADSFNFSCLATSGSSSESRLQSSAP